MRLAVLVLLSTVARADPYAWPHAGGLDTVAGRFPAPPGAARVAVADGSFGAWLRNLPLEPAGTAVHLFDGRIKPRQDVHAAVVALDVPRRDLQQCADAVMRLWAEYRYSRGATVEFHPDPGKPTRLTFTGHDRQAAEVRRGPPTSDRGKAGWLDDRPAFEKWLIRVFAAAGSASLAAELQPRRGPLVPGDVLIQGGYPGHAVIVLDVAERPDGTQLLLLAQSFMPAQQLHILKNFNSPSLSPWYDATTLTTGLATPEWRPFVATDVRHFPP